MISIIITSYKEPKTIGKAIESILNQKIKEKYELIVTTPDKETIDVAKEYKVKIIKDLGKGKALALNLAIKKAKGNILILTDGDVWISNNSINFILQHFKNKKVGAVTGRPISINKTNNMLGYWAKLLFQGAHKAREKRYKKSQFIECSGYLFAFRNIIKEFPKDIAEDFIIPLKLWEKGYKIDYEKNALVYIKNPDNIKDWIKQKKRTIKSHKTKKQKKIPKMKSFKNEIIEGFKIIFEPKSIKGLIWIILLFITRLYVWITSFIEIKLFKNQYSDNWQRIESTK